MRVRADRVLVALASTGALGIRIFGVGRCVWLRSGLVSMMRIENTISSLDQCGPLEHPKRKVDNNLLDRKCFNFLLSAFHDGLKATMTLCELQIAAIWIGISYVMWLALFVR
jgi:hypothetical protein